MFCQGDPPCTSAALCIQIDSGHSEAYKSGKERLLHVGVLLEGHVLDNRRQLVVVSNHDPTFQPAVAILWVLKGEDDGEERARGKDTGYTNHLNEIQSILPSIGRKTYCVSL